MTEKNGLLRFVLKDGKEMLQCVIWSSDARRLPKFENGDEILCRGQFGVYGSYLQLEVKELEAVGEGVLHAQFEELKRRLAAEGLFLAERRRPIPAFIRRIAVVSSPTAAGLDDFLKMLREHAPFVSAFTVETRLQGEGAEIEIADAIDRASRLDVEAIVITRGGGSYEDRFAFNREPVVRAIVRAKHPVITAIGHDKDDHLSDWVADKRCMTPTDAARFFGDMADRWRRRIDQASQRLKQHLGHIHLSSAQRFDLAARELDRCGERAVERRYLRLQKIESELDRRSPAAELLARRRRFDAVSSRLTFVANRMVERRREPIARAGEVLSRLSATLVRDLSHHLRLLDTRLGSLDPNEPLRRGYARVRIGGRALRDPADAPAGALIDVTVERGELRARVEAKTADE